MLSRWTRLLPVMMIAFIIAFMDRTNIGFAIPTMGAELKLDQSALGFASGVLFLGYGMSSRLAAGSPTAATAAPSSPSSCCYGAPPRSP